MITKTFIPFANSPSSLVWEGETLVDWVAGGNRYQLDGSYNSASRYLSDRFNGAVALPDGRCAAIFERRWTKGLVIINELENPKYTHIGVGDRTFSFQQIETREINRSYYQADVDEYPIALFYLPDGRPAILHCPDEYNRLEIELLETGERLPTSEAIRVPDFFHADLEISPSGRFALSSGWVWHPIEALFIFDVSKALQQPEALDAGYEVELDVSSATFINDEFLAMGLISEDVEEESDLLGKSQINIFDLVTKETVHKMGVDRNFLSIVAARQGYVWDLYEYPKIIDLKTGKIVAACPEVVTFAPTSIMDTEARFYKNHPLYALHPDRQRLAVGTNKGIFVLTFEGP